MSAETVTVAVLALAVGLVGGGLLGWALRRPVPAPPAVPEAAPEDDTKPTLIPFRAPRDVGRNLARIERNQPPK